jgi:hypothetical protein
MLIAFHTHEQILIEKKCKVKPRKNPGKISKNKTFVLDNTNPNRTKNRTLGLLTAEKNKL